ncbi:MAG: DUF1538 domain-containing protein [Deltaproteobacteria bacterium]|nr:DUF1538 domain-containing protein [Deltaproteobacteria bacterium]
MEKEVKFFRLVQETAFRHIEISYNNIVKHINRSDRIRLESIDLYRLLYPYIRSRFREQLIAVIPLVIYLALFQIIFLRQTIEDALTITLGIAAVITGLMFFMEGLLKGLMPFGELLGNKLPQKSRLPTLMLITFLLGVGVTYAEPAIGALKTAGSIVDIKKAAYLYMMLNQFGDILPVAVGIGVGIAAVLGTLRFLKGWSLKSLIYITLIPTIGLTILTVLNEQLKSTIGLAWDCGAVTTGPVTVPLVLALGIGIASSGGKGESSLSGFGIVTLASLFPIISVLLFANIIYYVYPVDINNLSAVIATDTTAETSFLSKTPYLEILLGIRATVPLILFLIIVLRFILREKLRNPLYITYGIVLLILGMIIFNIGLTYGLSNLGNQSGGLVPAAFSKLESVEKSPLYSYSLGIIIALLFAFCLGFGATLAEPALNSLGYTVENLTNGIFKKSMLMYSVSLGVGIGIMLGILKITFDIPLHYLLLPLYFAGFLLTIFSSEEYVNVAWDSAGVTTGPVTVPLVLAMGLGIGAQVGVVEGFGILAMASVYPILAVLFTGLYAARKRQLAEDEGEEGIVFEQSKEEGPTT